MKKIIVSGKPHLSDEILEKTVHNTVPLILISQIHVDGFNYLKKLEFNGELGKSIND